MAPRPRVAFKTMGCRVNMVDSEHMRQAALARGYQPVPFDQPADVYVLNSCTVTHQADREARRLVRAARRRAPQARVVLTGCYAEVWPDRADQLGVADLVLGTLDKPLLFDHLDRLQAGAPAPEPRPWRGAGPLQAPTLDELAATTRAFVKVQDGCNHRCSFCIIPKARGPSRSLPADQVVEALRSHKRAGVHEAVLTGVHLAAYGRDLARPGAGADLEALVQRLATEPDLPRLRLSSIEPVDLPEEVVEAMADHPQRFCRHLHMAVQSGSDRILEAMKRRYRRRDFLARAAQVFARLPGVAVGLDVLVGFPGETPEDHQATISLVEALPFAYAHVFPYSPREGTPAAGLPRQVPPPTRTQRVAEVQAAAEASRAGYLADQVGARLEAVVIRDPAPASEDAPERPAEALTDTFLKVQLDQPAGRGDLVSLTLARAPGGELVGQDLQVLAPGPQRGLAV